MSRQLPDSAPLTVSQLTAFGLLCGDVFCAIMALCSMAYCALPPHTVLPLQNPNRTILGAPQTQYVKDQLSAAQGAQTWKVLGQQVWRQQPARLMTIYPLEPMHICVPRSNCLHVCPSSTAAMLHGSLLPT